MTIAEGGDIFQQRLQAARELRKLTQSQLAATAGLPASSVSHFEAGARKPSFDNLKRLAGALAVTTDYLLGRSDDPDTSGAVGRLHRDQHKLSAEDLKLTEDFVNMLLLRSQKKD
ncbi:helix-turn-helix transcriptional regulator [Methylobacterium sp.]|uniref:helix-turn-helix domain-containing protein n=1 Tax=Methylobacterium sp. TaxID=409 RepID=UPI000C631547|nr:helix-turn-helix transcriptional regulator [Methylobacterium sp.]MBP29006.1 XRE family transcriptional regulator [Methylobacterium sp.]